MKLINYDCLPILMLLFQNGLSQRISELSSTKKDFEEAAPFYIEAMKQAKHDCQIIYAKENHQTSKQKTRKRIIIWYNPPFKNKVSTNITKEFFMLMRKYFPKKTNIINYSTKTM